jgi:hypothetical protein
MPDHHSPTIPPHAPLLRERTVVHIEPPYPVFLHEEHRPIGPFIVNEPIFVHPTETLSTIPVDVIQPLVFSFLGGAPDRLQKVLAELETKGYKVAQLSPLTGTLEHGNFFTRFHCTYAYEPASEGLQVSVDANHRDKITADMQQALLLTRG